MLHSKKNHRKSLTLFPNTVLGTHGSKYQELNKIRVGQNSMRRMAKQ